MKPIFYLAFTAVVIQIMSMRSHIKGIDNKKQNKYLGEEKNLARERILHQPRVEYFLLARWIIIKLCGLFSGHRDKLKTNSFLPFNAFNLNSFFLLNWSIKKWWITCRKNFNCVRFWLGICGDRGGAMKTFVAYGFRSAIQLIDQIFVKIAYTVSRHKTCVINLFEGPVESEFAIFEDTKPISTPSLQPSDY